MALTPGARLGPRNLASPVKAAWALSIAHDARLGRDVVIKALREDVMGDGDRRARFVPEASRIREPSNIVTVHDIGSEGDVVW